MTRLELLDRARTLWALRPSLQVRIVDTDTAALSSNGKTPDFGSEDRGSIPWGAAK